ncbi:hypothetical protein Hypma_013693 [Hypsizygus marmoreus]|uniref:Methyltransferase type 11 domain-containing protein n=1 Tax=Hypsizygus marmoreus TaxID=39966 RepID=A0A369JHT4_HYPMA|nr:hypothetical protein Hypma_013693 [Hypsizygus marmoreus]
MSSETPQVDHFAEANKAHFNNIANEYDELPHARERARRTANAVRKAYSFDENETTVMEFACGTGLVSRELAPYSKRIVGVDISQGMVDQFNRRVTNQGIPFEEMNAVCVELKGEAGELGDERFDVIFCASSYHHFTSIDDVTRVLAYFLKPGGSLFVVDLMKEGRGVVHGHDHGHGEGRGHGQDDGHEHGHDHGHGHGHGHEQAQSLFPEDVHKFVPHRHGLGEEDMRKVFEGAGLESFSFENAFTAKQHDRDVKLFIASGKKSTGVQSR